MSDNPRPTISLLTDFGDLDPYVGIMKGVLTTIAPDAQLVDLTHNIAPGDIQAGAYALLQSAPYFPRGTVHLAVVDPGVGSQRRPIAVAAEPGRFVGPDNGLFTYIMARYPHRVVELTEPRYHLQSVSNTFHGRDIFSPAAAHLALGVALEAFGPPVNDPVKLDLPRFEDCAPAQVAGQILHGDRFGNLASSIAWLTWEDDDTLALRPWIAAPVAPRRFSASRATVVAGAGITAIRLAGIHRTFSDVPAGEAAAIIGSERHLDIAVNRGSARDQLGLKPGDDVILHLAPD